MKKLISIILVLSILMGFFSGCNRNTEGPSFNIIPIDPNMGPTGKEIVKPKTGPVGTWDIPIPLINPLGSQSLYNGGVYYEEKGSIDIQYIDNFIEYRKKLSGETWTLVVEEPSGIPIHFLTDYAEEIGGSVFSSAYADSIIFTLNQPDAIWWSDVKETYGGYEINIVKQTVLAVGKEYNITADKFGDAVHSDVAFVTESSGERFQTVIIKLTSGMIRVLAESVSYSSETTVYKRYDKILDSNISDFFILDDFPQGAGIFDWKFEPYGFEEMPGEISFMIEESYEITMVKPGDEPGLLVVKGAPFGTVYVEPQAHVQVNYTEGSRDNRYGEKSWFEGSITPDGDTQFWLPSGYWTVVNNAPYMNYGSTKTQLVPVSSGEETIVTLPDSLKSANARLNSMADDSELTGYIEINDIKDNRSTADISISISDPQAREIIPTKENTIIYESAAKVEITNIKREIAPSSIALVIDSSGSMRNDMKATLESAKEFINMLPAGSFVKVVHFNSQVKVLNGETTTDAIKALSGITAGGSTRLFDAAIKGLELVKDRPRPAVVVFTDGIDSSIDKNGIGSSNPKSAVLDLIRDSKIPVYTIGFGKRLNEEEAVTGQGPVEGVPDIQALLEFAAVSGGQYYPAKDPAALQGVFTAIGSKLGNNYVITYKRPQEHRVSDTPFISMVVDNSGSMNSHPSEGIDTNYRMEKTISLFHDFVKKIPQNAMMQFTTFQTPIMSPPQIIQHQITSDKKANILKALGEMDAHGGTPIVEALRTAYENILPVPSSKKIIVFLTDGGLEVEEEQIGQYNNILEKIKEKNINILFIGMGSHSQVHLFVEAAAKTGGDYVISEDIEEIITKLDRLLLKLKEPTPADTIPLSFSINYSSPNGEELSYFAAEDVKLTLPQKTGSVIVPDLVRVTPGKPVSRYDVNLAAAVTGMGVPGIDNILTNKMTFNKKLSNDAMTLTVKNGYYFSKFMGVEGGIRGMQFVALELELENKTPDKIRYEIPSIFNHFYYGSNGEGLYPASKATWLADKPLSPRGNPEAAVEPKNKTVGVIVFTLPASSSLTQQSLHFYDTNYGHIQIPLTGKMPDKWAELTKLPAAEPVKLSDAFSMKVTAASLVPKVDIHEAEENSAFRVIEAQFQSKVQAILNLDPKERIWLKLDTMSGALMSKMSDVTAALPFGFLEPVMLGPASDSIVRFAYDLPQLMGRYKSGLYIDLATGKVEIPVSAGDLYGSPKAVATFEDQGIKVIINQITAVDDSIQFLMPDGKKSYGFGNTVLLDVTFADLPGNDGTIIPGDFFSLVNKNYDPSSSDVAGGTVGRIGIGASNQSSDDIKNPTTDTQNLIFGVNEDFGVFENQARRGIMVFDKPGGNLSDWSLQSPYITSIHVPITTEKFASPELLAVKKEVIINKEFENELDQAVAAAVEKYKTLEQGKPFDMQIALSAFDERERVPMPPITTHGLMTIAKVTNEEKFYETMQGLRYLPINRDHGYLQSYGYEPEAVLTQGWGEIGDITNLANRLLSKLGFNPKVRVLTLTAAGKKYLFEQTGLDPERAGTIPLGISYQNEKGERKVFVVPFMMDISELKGVVYFPSDNMNMDTGINQPTARISVYVRYVPGENEGTVASNVGDIGSILGGDEDGEAVYEILMLDQTLPLNILSTDAIDITFMSRSGAEKQNSYNALLGWSNTFEPGDNVLVNPSQVLGIKIVIEHISDNENPLVHYSTLAEGDSLANFFYTIAINLPDLTEEAAENLDALAKKVHSGAKNPDPESIAKWYGRNILYRFISGQSMFDTQMVNDLNLVMGRVWRPRAIIVSSRLSKDGIMHTSIDLLQAFNEIHSGDENAKRAYNLSSGFYMSSLEADALPGDNKAGYLSLWAKAPSGTIIELIPLLEDDRDEIYNDMAAENKFPMLLLERVKENRKVIFVPTNPTVFNGQKRWAWLEIDPDTYQAISVFDTGEQSAMTEFRTSLLPSTDDTVQWMKGIWVGTNVSVWSMCSSTLKYGDEYAMVLNDAKKVAMEVGKVVGEFFSIVENVKNKDFGFSLKLNESGTHKIDTKISMSGFKGSLKQNMYDLNGGFKLAVDTYFKVIVPQPPKKS